MKPGYFRMAVGLLLFWSAGTAWAQTNLIYHRFRFFLHSDLAQGISSQELKSRLVFYAQDINLIFAKNTNRRFTFDPDQDIIVTEQLPTINLGGEIPETDYELWASVLPAAATPYPYSHGGWMAFSTNGTGVAQELYWDAVHDRAALVQAAPDDWILWNYWRQIHNLVHEMAHIFGAAVGEYYNLRNVPDTTGVSPLQDIYFSGNAPPVTDPYWAQHPDYLADPMSIWAPRLTLTELTNQVRFANVTAAMINAGYRHALPPTRYTPDLAATKVWVRTRGAPVLLPQTPVKVWRVEIYNACLSQLIFDGATSAAGFVQFAWNAEPNNADNLMVIKAWPTNAPPIVRWFSIYDAQEERMVLGHTNLNIYLDVALTNPPAISIHALTNQVLLRWASIAAGYELESTTNLSALDWQPVSAPLVDEDGATTLRLPAAGAARYFRLHQR